MILSVTLLILVIGSLPPSGGIPFENSEAHKLLTTGEAMARLTLLKREISSNKKEALLAKTAGGTDGLTRLKRGTGAAGRGLVYSGPVKVMTDNKDRSKYYMDKGSAFDSTAQEPQPHHHKDKSPKQHSRTITTGKFLPEPAPEEN